MTATGAPSYEQYGLHRLGGRPTLRRYLQLFWQRRHFTFELARSRFRAENEQERLGIFWVVGRPLLNAAVYGTVFGLILPNKSRPEHHFIAFLVTGIFFFQFFAGCLSDGARSITANVALVRTLHFPRALLPVATVLQQLFAMVFMVVVLLFLLVASGVWPRWQWILVVPVLLMQTLFNAGVAFIAARATIHIRDIAQLIPFVTRILFYVSGLFYSLEKVFKAHPAVAHVLSANPIHIYITLARGALVPGQHVPWHYWIYGPVWGVAACLIGFVFFWKAEERYGRE